MAFFQDIEFVQVLVLLYVVGMQITVMVPILIAQVARQEIVILVMGGILADIETLHLLIVEDWVVAGNTAAEVLMGLETVLDLSEVKA